MSGMDDFYRTLATEYRCPAHQASLDRAAEAFNQAFQLVGTPANLRWVTAKQVVVVAYQNWHSLGNGQRVRPQQVLFGLHHCTLGQIDTLVQAAAVVEVFDLVRDSDSARAALRQVIKSELHN